MSDRCVIYCSNSPQASKKPGENLIEVWPKRGIDLGYFGREFPTSDTFDGLFHRRHRTPLHWDYNSSYRSNEAINYVHRVLAQAAYQTFNTL